MAQGDDLFGIDGTALRLRSQRLNLLASNIANAATPGYQARDVDFDQVSKIAGAITPVPGGVGPMTVAMLISNCVSAAERGLHRPSPSA